MRSRCHKYLNAVQTIFGDEEKKSPFVLHNSKLDAADILVHPDTFQVTCSMDWEMINTVPEWRASNYPWFLTYADPEDEEEPPIPFVL